MQEFNQSAGETVGRLLCATRMRLGKDLQAIAEILHIRYNYLVAMEDGRYEDLPGQAYAIGFVRAYADYLGLDGGEIVRRYKEESSGLKNRPVFEFPLTPPDSGVPSGALILVAMLLGMSVYGVWYAIAGSDRGAVQVIQDVPDRLNAMLNPPAEMPVSTEAPVENTDAAIAAADSDTDTAPVTEPNALPSDPQASSTDQMAAAAPVDVNAPPPPPAESVELRAKSDVWITLRTTNNPDRTQLLHKGEVFKAPEGGGGITLITATPADLEILVDGQVMPPLDAGVFARGVPLDPARLKGGGVTASPATAPKLPGVPNPIPAATTPPAATSAPTPPATSPAP